MLNVLGVYMHIHIGPLRKHFKGILKISIRLALYCDFFLTQLLMHFFRFSERSFSYFYIGVYQKVCEKFCSAPTDGSTKVSFENVMTLNIDK